MSEESFRLGSYPEANFGGFSDVDGGIKFYPRVNALLEPSSVVLDIGCGTGAYRHDDVIFRRNLRILRGKCRRVIGIDIDEAARENPFLDEFRPIREDRWPVEDGTIDLCVSDYVLEHVAQPELFFAECARVLKPGGSVCARTPNRFGYVAIVAQLIPNRWHPLILRKAGKTREVEDVFPTLYRCNTAGRIRRLMRRYGFEGCVLRHEDEPTYLLFWKTAYYLGAVVHRLTPPIFRGNLLVYCRKAA